MNPSILTVIGRVVFAAGVALASSTPVDASAVNPHQVEQQLLSQQPARRSTGQSQPTRRPTGQSQPTRRSTGQNQPTRRPTGQNQPTRRPTTQNNLQVPEPVANAVLENLSQQIGVQTSALRIVQAEPKTWSDGCLGLGSPGIACAPTLVPGWQVLVGRGNQRWIYRTNLSGSLVKLDAAATQALAERQTTTTSRQTQRPTTPPRQTQRSTTPPRQTQRSTTPPRQTERPTTTPQQAEQPTTTPQQTERPTTTTRQAERPTTTPRQTERPTTAVTQPAEQPPAVVGPRNRIQPPSGQTAMQGAESFSLAIRQPSGTLSDIIARVSVKATQRNGAYSPERFIGDYRYRPNQRASFRRGMNAGDRVVVRLYNFQNALIGYSEFEVLPNNAAVNLVLGNRPTSSRIVRTVYGIDANADGNIDPGSQVYDYFTLLSGNSPGQEQVTFLTKQDIDLTWYQVVGLPVPPQTSLYPGSMSSGASVVFTSNLPAVLTAIPGKESQVINLPPGNTSTYDLSQLPGTTRAAVRRPTTPPPAGVQPATTTTAPAVEEVAISFPDVPANYWARGFIGQLVARELLQGYPDGLYRPNEPVTRAELATIISKAFDRNKAREMVTYRDVPTNHWAYPAIRDAYEMGFLGSPTRRTFNPDEKVSRLDVLVALARGLNYSPSRPTETLLRAYRDASSIPSEERRAIAAATEKGIVVNYPNVRVLNPRRVATRAEVAALIYQALVSTGEAGAITSPYVVGENVAASEAEPRQRPRSTVRQTPTRRRTPTTQPARQTPSTQQRRSTSSGTRFNSRQQVSPNPSKPRTNTPQRRSNSSSR